MTDILLMGGSRFIGKHLLHRLADDTTNNIVVINRGSVSNEKYLPKGVDHIAVDRNDKEAMQEALMGKSFHFIFDISAISGGHVQILLDSLSHPPKRHVHVSSGSVYDIHSEDNPLYTLPVAEDFPIGPINEDEHPYMNDKRSAEKVLYDMYTTENYPMTIVRPTFVYGPDNYIYREAYFFDRILNERPVLLPHTGSGFQDLVFVDDLVELMIVLAEENAMLVEGEAFNGTKGEVMTGDLYAKLVAKIIGKDYRIVYYDPAELVDMGLPVEEMIYPYLPQGGVFFDVRKIEEQLDFTTQVTYEVGLTQSFEWWKEHGEKQEDFALEDALVAYIDADPEEKQKREDELQTAIDEIVKTREKKNQVNNGD